MNARTLTVFRLYQLFNGITEGTGGRRSLPARSSFPRTVLL